MISFSTDETEISFDNVLDELISTDEDLEIASGSLEESCIANTSNPGTNCTGGCN